MVLFITTKIIGTHAATCDRVVLVNTERPLTDARLLRYEQNSFGCISQKLANCKFSIIAKYIQNYSANISATVYPSESVLYSKRTGGYTLSSHIKKIAAASVAAEI